MSTGPGAASVPAPTTAHESPPTPGAPEAPPDATSPDTPVPPAADPESTDTREHMSMFRSLRIRNYRLFFVGQVVSNIGTWMQRIAQDWLVLSLTGSSTAVGVGPSQ